MNVGEGGVHFSWSAMDLLKAGEEETHCGGSILRVESPEPIIGPRQKLEKERWGTFAWD